ncbi:hypothetical protein BS78_02G343700 [Paspalum vaginatum]|nr:hypothetical protein BS78_02G343700 [Paspalum vaginatum]
MAITETVTRKLLRGDAAVTIARGAADVGGIIFGLWELVTGFFANIFAQLVAARLLVQPLEAFWQWIQAAAAAVLPFVLGVVAVLLLVALIWFCGTTICVVTVGVCKALVYAVCYLGLGMYCAGVAVATALSCLVPPCGQCLGCCAEVTMRAPGAAGMLISRAAFEAAPALYFVILRAAGPVVAAAVFCTRVVARIVAVRPCRSPLSSASLSAPKHERMHVVAVVYACEYAIR